VGEYNTVKSQISAALRKAGGSLAVRDISGLVQPGQLVDSENLGTLFVVVGKYSVKDWEACYQGLADFVVREAAPRQRPAVRRIAAGERLPHRRVCQQQCSSRRCRRHPAAAARARLPPGPRRCLAARGWLLRTPTTR